MKHTLTFDGTEISFEAPEADAQAITRVITDLIEKEGFINIDADDVKSVVEEAENVFAGEGTGSGKNRCSDAALEAVKGIKGAKKILLAITTGPEITLAEMTEAAIAIEEASEPDAAVIWGHVIDEAMGDDVKVSIVAAK
ncbi:MAG: hypothetical protein IJS28_01575 [Synergistaceae bacterium]|nr:hypothetical protein [Synergistaceae bacterium]